jgi:hypothetical protein
MILLTLLLLLAREAIGLEIYAVSAREAIGLEIRVDLIEVNHFNDGHNGYDQVILYRWSPDYCRYDVVTWYLANSLDCYPRQVHENRYEAVYKSQKGDRRIVARSLKETWTDRDPERDQKRLLAERYRDGWQ